VTYPRTKQANLPAYLHTILFYYAERQAGKLWIPTFKFFGRTIYRLRGRCSYQ